MFLSDFHSELPWLAQPWVEALIGLAILAAIALIGKYAVGAILARLTRQLTALRKDDADGQLLSRAARRVADILPALIVARGIGLVAHLPAGLVIVVSNVANALIILLIVRALSAMLDFVNARYQHRPYAAQRPIKGYVQVVKILLYGGAAILMAAILMEQSPLLLLSGLGAMAAVLMLVFKDTILSLVASVQLSSNDMVRVGDWIEMPQFNADGDVVDIALHTVKVQNWDKTITTIPTYKLIEGSFKNWRPMFEGGGRRIKRSLLIDQNSVRFLEPDEQARLRRFALIDDYLNRKQTELEEWNRHLTDAGRDPVNARRVTNLGTFRAYVLAYLKANPRIAQQMLMIVRQMQPTPQGLPLEIYCFTANTAWVVYEDIQADLFDHLLAILPEFDLRLFQDPSGADMRGLAAATRTLAIAAE